MYAYMGGAIALIGGVWYFRTHNTGPAVAAPQVNATPITDAAPVPYPSGGGIPVPPTPAFVTSGQVASDTGKPGNSNVLPTSTANFIPTAPQLNNSQAFAASVTPSTSGPAAIDQPATIPNPFGPQYPDIVVAGANKMSGTIAQRNTSAPVPVATPVQAQQIAAAVANIPIIGKLVQAAANKVSAPPAQPPPSPPAANVQGQKRSSGGQSL